MRKEVVLEAAERLTERGLELAFLVNRSTYCVILVAAQAIG